MHHTQTHETELEPTTAGDRGATAIEYAMIVSLIAAVVTATVALVGLDALSNWVITW